MAEFRNMTTTADLIDICNLYYTQAFAQYFASVYNINRMNCKRLSAFRCTMYALSARLILEGVY